jgi:EAL domain-containing protein (putative c-di-GMP-specific phosphodiesterase class I)
MNHDRLLMIDDESGFRNYVRRVGEASGFETFVTGDARVFKEHVRSWHPSVIMMDLQMPGADGIELLRDLVDARSSARVLIASGVDSKILDAAERLAGEHGLAIAGALQKPFRASVLREMLESLREIDQPLLADALAHAIRTDNLLIEYQPKLDCKSGQIYQFEALVRWQHPTRGIIPPDQFIPLAEDAGLIHDLTEWVIRAAIGQVAAWRNQGVQIEIAVNLSALDLQNIKLPDFIAGLCEAEGVATDCVTLEVTESAAMGAPAQTMDVLTRLRLKGFQLSIDDFGTGYSSLVQLRKMPFSELKIDKSFAIPMNRNPDCHAIVEAVVGLGQKLGLSIVVEGVETADVLESVREMGVDAAQGFFISRPAPADRIAEIVGTRFEGPR